MAVVFGTFPACKEKPPEDEPATPTPAAASESPTPAPTESSTPTPTPTAEDAIRSLIERNVNAMAAEDLDGVMATIKADSPIYEPTERTVRRAFDALDLTFELEEIEILDVADSSAEIRIIQVTRATEPGAGGFRDNRIVAVHQLERIDDQWFFVDSEVTETTYLAPESETPASPTPEPTDPPEATPSPTETDATNPDKQPTPPETGEAESDDEPAASPTEPPASPSTEQNSEPSPTPKG